MTLKVTVVVLISVEVLFEENRCIYNTSKLVMEL